METERIVYPPPSPSPRAFQLVDVLTIGRRMRAPAQFSLSIAQFPFGNH